MGVSPGRAPLALSTCSNTVSFLSSNLTRLSSFDLSTITDNTDALFITATSFLGKPVHSHAAGLLLARLLSRKDQAERLDAFSTSCLEIITDPSSDPHVMQGWMGTLALIFKLAPRLDVQEATGAIMRGFESVVRGTRARNAVIRKLVLKLGTRVGLACLKPRVASWRYDRGNSIPC
jgi:hypothetical protein